MSGAFFHKGITRFQAELYLTNTKDNGSFLVRDSESLAGAYVLCLLLNSEVHQYRILPGPDGKLHVQSESGTIQRGYNDLTELIADYIKKKENNGLACGLVHPVAPEGSNDDGELTDDDDDDDDEEDDDDDFEHPPPVQSPPATPTDKKKNNEAEKIDLQRNFNKLDLTRCDSVFKKALKDYVDIGSQKDSTALNAGDSELQEFEKLLDSTASGLRRELDTYMRNIEVLHELLKVENRKNSTLDHRHRPCGPGLPNLLEQMSRVRSKILSLQTEAQETIQLASIPSDYEYLDYTDPMYAGNGLTSGPFLMSKYRPYIPQSKFEVKKLKSNRPTKLTLTVDLQNGKYSVLKQTGKESLSHNTISHDRKRNTSSSKSPEEETPHRLIDHDRILHLIKSTKDKCNLDVILDGKNKQTYAFHDPHMRENFCLQIRQMKNMHSTETDIDQISLFIGTWNMGDASLNQSLSTWLKCTGSGTSRDRVLGVIPHDVYVVGTQESSMTEKDWVNQLKAGLKACVLVDMELVEVSSLWGIRLAILCKPELKAFISRVQRSSVRTGIANTFGNKGAVAISFYFNGTSFCFINTHLTSGDERCNRRNQNYRDIIKGLTMSLGQKHLSLFDITNQFHHVFWLGDLNYRVEEEIQVLLRKINEKDINFLLERDQLKRLQKQRTVFSAFDEADITFLPTYRLERNVPGYKYAWKKIKATSERINAPSWCDRVLWKSYPGQFIESVAYGCSEAILSSDHRPVFSSFNVGISSEFVHHARMSLAEMAIVQIVFTAVEAQVKTCCKQYFQLVFHSTCLQEVYRSQSNTSFRENRTGFFTVPVWVATNLPEMRPLFGDVDYLEDQHILIAVVAKDSDNESYGECVLSLREMFSDEPKPFEYTLLHQGEETGKISGKMHLKTKGKKTSSSRSGRNNYSLIALDTEYHDPEMYLPDHPTHKPPGAFRGSVKPGMGPGQSKPPLGSTMSSHNNTAPKPPLRQTVSTMDDRMGGPMTRETNQRSMRMEGRAPAPLPSSPTSLTPIPPARRGTPVMGQGSLRVAPPVRQRSAPGSAPQKHVPPIPPKQRTVSGPDHHYINRQDGHKRPKTLDEWLAQLNLSVYEKNFTDYGWDSLLYLGELKLEDLIRIGVEVPEHQRMILASIRDLNKV
ncbi:SHIP2-like protein [Mya arenaria]|uniref:phosphatidylinositol-3,4,5-trisphosphate 5-phosphatase n=1 Tax=Mya arenaria TaxID=6604 RepID=A0ABY7G1N4_MYAAR|nr:SHIP2-like protein [Mya arenaria]